VSLFLEYKIGALSLFNYVHMAVFVLHVCGCCKVLYDFYTWHLFMSLARDGGRVADDSGGL
jgi:hypothetical protein